MLKPVSKSSSRPLSVLDIGGTVKFWSDLGLLNPDQLDITLVNLKFKDTDDSNINLKYITGDARDLSMFEDNQFDVVFSNSVIEHVGGYNDQLTMAEEIRRVGRAYFLQTPNFYFPIEPHYRALGFHFLPFAVRTFLLQHVGVGLSKKTGNKKLAIKEANRVRLLTLKKLKRLFPEAGVHKERFLGLTKALIVHHGFDRLLDTTS